MNSAQNRCNKSNLVPLRRMVTGITGEAAEDDQQQIQKAIRRWHNRLANGSVPRSLFVKIGRELFLKIDAWNRWIASKQQTVSDRARGRPRTR
jgi:hypothetical protein